MATLIVFTYLISWIITYYAIRAMFKKYNLQERWEWSDVGCCILMSMFLVIAIISCYLAWAPLKFTKNKPPNWL